ncbi:MAG: SPOR domain-containing protein [Methylotetracoccus sp.]|nr:SPOR domain-containing protein [Methylotetracoccus sp.]
MSDAAAATSATLTNAGQAATQFFGSLFSGSAGGDASPAEQVAAAQESPVHDTPAPVPVSWVAETKTVPAPARVETASISKPVEAASKAEPAWGAATATSETAAAKPAVIAFAETAGRDTTAASQPPVQIATAAGPTASADVAQPAAMPGPYRLQIAAENSREDAEQTLARLVSKHKTSLKGLEPVIEEPQTGTVLFGSMGAAYRVSLGPYQNKVEPGRLCNILQPHGFDCRVVSVSP